MSPRHALFVDGAYVDLDVGYEWPMPGARRAGTVQHTPYGLPWDDGTDEAGRSVYRAEPTTVTLYVGGVSATDAANRAETWTQLMLRATRLRDNTTGRFLELLLVRSLGARSPVRGTGYTLTFEVEYLNPYWHAAAGDGSALLHPSGDAVVMPPAEGGAPVPLRSVVAFRGTYDAGRDAPLILGAAFETVPLVAATDTRQAFSDAESVFVIPESGWYEINTKLRLGDGLADGVGFGHGAGTANVDSPSFQWFVGNPYRNGSLNTISNAFTGGDRVRMFAYVDSGGIGLYRAEMTITKLGDV